MYVALSLLVALGITAFVVSRLMEMLSAKEPGIERVVAAILVGSIAAIAALVAMMALFSDLDALTMMLASIAVMFLVATLAFKSINKMTWAGAITANIASISLLLITATAALVFNGIKPNQTIETVRNTFHEKTSIVTGKPVPKVEEAVEEEEYNANPTFREVDLLPPATVQEMKEKKKVVYKEPKFQAIKLSEIGSVIGKKIRIDNNNATGSKVEGVLRGINGNDIIIEQRKHGGVATIALSKSRIKGLEVYR